MSPFHVFLPRDRWLSGEQLPYHCACGLVLCKLDPVRTGPDRCCWICARPRTCRISAHDIGRLYTRAIEQQKVPGKRARQAYVLQHLKRRPCAYCGQSFPPVAMDFHHVRRDLKDGRPETMQMAACAAELTKCIVLCACCHRIEEAARGRRQAAMCRRINAWMADDIARARHVQQHPALPSGRGSDE